MAKDRVISTVDPQTRHAHKSRHHRQVDSKRTSRSSLRPGSSPAASSPRRTRRTARPVLPCSTVNPTGSRCSLIPRTDQVRADLEHAGHSALIKSWPLGRNPKLGDDQFHRDDFSVDHAARSVTCPNGITVTISPGGFAKFGTRCVGCTLRSRCAASADGKTFTVTEHDEHLAVARARWRDGHGIDDYRQHRPMAERSIAWLVTKGHRRVRYRAVERNQVGLPTRAATLNLRRLINLGLDWNQGWQLS